MIGQTIVSAELTSSGLQFTTIVHVVGTNMEDRAPLMLFIPIVLADSRLGGAEHGRQDISQ